jgi:predicted translin family RNA/ssDNA-binding protein
LFENKIFRIRNVVELQHVNQKLDKLVREMRAQNNNDDEDLNRTRFDELKKEHQQQQEKLKETKNQLDSFETQVEFLRKLNLLNFHFR